MAAEEYAALCDDLEAEHAALDAVVARLSEQHWSMPTPAEGWTISDAILHLALTDEVAALAASDPAAFEGYRHSRRGGTDPFQTSRGMLPADLLDLWRTNRRCLLESLRTLDPKGRVSWFRPPMAAMSHATARLMETWAYGQDVADAFGIECSATSRLKHIAHLGVRTRGYSYTQHGLTPPADAVRVELRVRTGHCGHGVSRRRPTT
jgi:uncharacterized protein (TIGR03084 family)